MFFPYYFFIFNNNNRKKIIIINNKKVRNISVIFIFILFFCKYISLISLLYNKKMENSEKLLKHKTL